MKKKFLRRLEILATVLENFNALKPVQIKKFDMTDWYNCQNVKADGNYSCKTAACALGTAAFIPFLQKEGLTPIIDIYDNEYLGVRMKGFDSEDPFDVAEAFFGITESQAEELFDYVSYDVDDYDVDAKPKIKPKMVAKKIRKIIAEANA